MIHKIRFGNSDEAIMSKTTKSKTKRKSLDIDIDMDFILEIGLYVLMVVAVVGILIGIYFGDAYLSSKFNEENQYATTHSLHYVDSVVMKANTVEEHRGRLPSNSKNGHTTFITFEDKQYNVDDLNQYDILGEPSSSVYYYVTVANKEGQLVPIYLDDSRTTIYIKEEITEPTIYFCFARWYDSRNNIDYDRDPELVLCRIYLPAN